MSSREFAIAMHLIMKVRQTQFVPTVLPASLANYNETPISAGSGLSGSIPPLSNGFSAPPKIPQTIAAPKSTSNFEDSAAVNSLRRPPSADLVLNGATTATTAPIAVVSVHAVESKADLFALQASFENTQQLIQQATTERAAQKNEEVLSMEQWHDKILAGQRELESIRHDIDLYNEQIKISRQQSQHFETQITQLSKDTDEWKKKKIEIEHAALAARNELTLLQGREAQLRQTFLQEQTVGQNLQKKFGAIRSQISEVMTEIERLQQEVESSQSSVMDQDTAVATAEHELNMAQSRLEQLRELKSTQELVIQSRKEQAARLVQEKGILTEKINSVSKEITLLKQKSQSQKESNAALRNELNLLQDKQIDSLEKPPSVEVGMPSVPSPPSTLNGSKPGSHIRRENNVPGPAVPPRPAGLKRLSLSKTVLPAPVANDSNFFNNSPLQDFANPFIQSSGSESGSIKIPSAGNAFTARVGITEFSDFSQVNATAPSPAVTWTGDDPFKSASISPVKMVGNPAEKKEEFNFSNDDNWANF